MKTKMMAITLCLALLFSAVACRDTTPPHEYVLFISSGNGGSVATPGEGSFQYEAGTVVDLVAEPADGYKFINWSGDVETIADVYAPSTTITVNGDYTIVADFEAEEIPSLTIIKYDDDGTTVVAQETRTYLQMEAELPVQGDGQTEYWHQGPTFDPDNLWNPDETENLKSRGVVKGTDLKDLLELVGGVSLGDVVQVLASDGLSRTFRYESIYGEGPDHPRFVITWYRADDGYVPDYESGMRLVFFDSNTNADGKHVFGNHDMQQYIHEDDWHYWSQDGVDYPAADGLSVKWVKEIRIYTGEILEWHLELAGAKTLTVTQSDFEDGLVCRPSHRAEYFDGTNTWTGMPLWVLVAMVDDDPDEGPDHYNFNDALAESGYTVRVIAGDGFSATFNSTFVARNNDLILANLVNGEPLEESRYPLRIVGPGLTGKQRVGNVVRIELEIPWQLELVGAKTVTVIEWDFQDGLEYHSAEYVDGDNTWTGIPLWRLVAVVDDDPDDGPDHYNFNDALAESGYTVRVIAGDGFSATFDSAFVARNNDLILASLLNGETLEEDSYPLRIAGPDLTGRQRVGNVVRIELEFPES